MSDPPAHCGNRGPISRSSAKASASASGSSCQRGAVLRRLFSATRSIAASTPKPSASRPHIPKSVYGTINTGAAADQQHHDDGRVACASGRLRRITLVLSGAHRCCSASPSSSSKGSNITTISTKHLFPGPDFPLSPPATHCSGVVLDHDRHPRHPSVGRDPVVMAVMRAVLAADHPGARIDHGGRRDLLALRRYGLAVPLPPALSGWAVMNKRKELAPMNDTLATTATAAVALRESGRTLRWSG